MRRSSLVPTTLLALLFTWGIPLVQANYFIVTAPSAGTQWANGAANLVSWVKGVDDGVDGVDVEMSRLSQDGIIYVAKDAPTAPGALNIFIQDLPVADDYYLLFLNSTSGNMFGSSAKFSIGSSANGTTSADPSVPTVTVSGAPNPTMPFATTFPATANGVAMPGWRALEGSLPQMLAMLSVVILSLLGGAWTVL
ncbi:hypothetical protein BC835DRAFT_1423695 [Cytidiella melzeri]|nr:hypothetical protein BC835DRAFT_1423695 [Cytidiella melzeri]